MRVLIFSTAYYPFVGGAEVAIKEITDRLGSEYEFDLITARMDSKVPCVEQIGAVNVYRVGWGIPVLDKWLLMKWGGWKAWQMNRKNKYDVAWSMMASWGGLAAWWFSVITPSVPLVVTLQEGDVIAERKFGLVALGWRLILSRARLVTVISNYLGAEARKFGYRGDVVLVPNGVDLGKFQISNFKFQNRLELRAKYGLKETDTVLITTSRLVEKNAVGDIIQSLKFLPENVKLLIAGTGELEQNLKFKIKNLKLESRVKILGFINQEDLPLYLHAPDIFIRPSLSEGQGISFLEAMAAGLPIIATPVGGIPDFLKDGETGLFCNVHDPKSIVEQVKRLSNNPVLHDHIIKQAQELISRDYSWDLLVERMRKEVFNKAVKK